MKPPPPASATKAKAPLSVAEALGRILDGVTPTGLETVPLMEACGRVLAANVVATLTQPPFDASAMDGYAVRAADVTQLPATLALRGESAAGSAFIGRVGVGETVRIFTGAPVPEGADAIVLQENVIRDGSSVTVQTGRPDRGHIRPRGGDFKEGEILIAAGRRITARDITLAAAAGHATLAVRRRPEVAILATGDELVDPGTRPGAAQIVCSNPYGVAAMVAKAGGTPRLLGIARDTRESLTEKIAAAAGADVLLTIGGASVGDHDLVTPVLQERGMKLAFWKIAMRPGKPLLFGRLGDQRVIGVPGTPVSSLVCTRVFLVPLIRRLLGLESEDDAGLPAVLARDVEANGPRQHYMRAKLTPRAGALPTVATVASQDSSLLKVLAEADCLLVRAPNAPALPAGSEVTVLPLDF